MTGKLPPAESIADWKYLYFAGITKQPLREVNLSSNNINALISMLNIQASISTGALLAPEFIINAKGTTPWMALHALLIVQDKGVFSKIAIDGESVFIPNTYLEKIFQDHINWPETLSGQYNIKLEGYNIFIIPFMVHKSQRYNLSMSEPLGAPDGSMEIFAAGEFDEVAPEKLLRQIDELISFIKEHRPDVLAS